MPENEKVQNIMAAVNPAPGPGPFAGSENTLKKDIMMVANSLAEINTREDDVLHCCWQPMQERLQRSSASTEKRTYSHFHGRTDAPSKVRGIIS